jgi:ribosomal protein L2
MVRPKAAMSEHLWLIAQALSLHTETEKSAWCRMGIRGKGRGHTVDARGVEAAVAGAGVGFGGAHVVAEAVHDPLRVARVSGVEVAAVEAWICQSLGVKVGRYLIIGMEKETHCPWELGCWR